MSRREVLDPLPSPLERFSALIAAHKARRENANVNKQVNQPIEGQRWRHRSGHVYTIVCIAMFESDCTDAVVYRNVDTGYTWVRTLSEFLERFTLVGDR
jgi:hypothetical protein